MSRTLNAFGGRVIAAGQRPTTLDLIALWRHRAHSRRELAALDRRLLGDIGVSPVAARAEAGRPFWRA